MKDKYKLVASLLKRVTIKRTAKENINFHFSKSEANVNLHQELQLVQRDPNPELTIKDMKMNKANKVARRLRHPLASS